MREVRQTAQFRRDLKRELRAHSDLSKLEPVAMMLARSEKLPEGFREHRLIGNYNGYSECHLASDIVLLFKSEDECVTLVRIGSHSEVLGV